MGSTSHHVDESSRCEIKPLDAQTSRRICSGQVITSMAVAVKELLENAIDAHATSLSIRFDNHGKEMIEVIDNGSGIAQDNFRLLAKRGCTSKLSSFDDLENVQTFGFRGEALSSLCNIANVSVHTRHADDVIGTILKFGTSGTIVSQEMRAREIGTTVSLGQLFFPLPVRRKEFEEGCRRAFDKTLSLIYQYCIGLIGIRIACFHKHSHDGRYSNLFTSTGLSIQSNIIEIFDYKQFSSLMPFVLHTDLHQESMNGKEEIPFEMNGYISKPDTGCGRSSSDRQYFYLNERPCDLAVVSKRINQIYRTYNRTQYPFVLLKITIDEKLIDRNLTPDKRKIFLSDNHYIFKVIQHSLDRMFSRESTEITSLNSSKLLSTYLNTSSEANVLSTQQPKRILSPYEIDVPESFSDNFRNSKIFKRSTSPCELLLENVPPANQIFSDDQSGFTSMSHYCLAEKSQESSKNQLQSSKPTKHPFFASLTQFKPTFTSTQVSIPEKLATPIVKPSDESLNNCDNYLLSIADEILASDDFDGETNCSPANDAEYEANQSQNSTVNNEQFDASKQDNEIVTTFEEHSEIEKLEQVQEVEEFDPSSRLCFTLDCDIEQLCEEYSNHLFHSTKGVRDRDELLFKAQITPDDNENALNELRHTLTKQSFGMMQVIGQFNLGFIIAKIDRDLFIVDQHAIDERHNFEQLLNNPNVDNQNLVCPLNLRLSSLNEMIVSEHVSTFNKLGFGIVIKREAPIGERVFLTRIPLGKEWIGGRSDVEEIIAAIRESPNGDILDGRHFMLSGLRREVAYRACRSSVMIGEALLKPHMAKLLYQMADLRDPWHCAHNRPTIRHLVSLERFELQLR